MSGGKAEVARSNSKAVAPIKIVTLNDATLACEPANNNNDFNMDFTVAYSCANPKSNIASTINEYGEITGEACEENVALYVSAQIYMTSMDIEANATESAISDIEMSSIVQDDMTAIFMKNQLLQILK